MCNVANWLFITSYTEERGVKKDSAVLMATNPLEETVLSENVSPTAGERETAVEETTMTNPINEN